jgi:hypothetical protein
MPHDTLKVTKVRRQKLVMAQDLAHLGGGTAHASQARMRTRPVAALAALLVLGACSQKVYSPPARGLALDSPAPLAAGDTTVGLRGGALGGSFGPTVAIGGLSLRRGLTSELELSGDASYYAVTDHSPSGTAPGIFAGRVGAKMSPHLDWPVTLGLAFGAGGGVAEAGGGFVAADVAGLIAYENCYVVPYGSIGALVSEPIDARPIDVTSDKNTMPVYATAETTYGVSFEVGARVKLQPGRCREQGQSATLTLGVGGVRLTQASGPSDGFGGLQLGIEFPL